VGAVEIAQRFPRACGIPQEFQAMVDPVLRIHKSGRLGSFHGAWHQTRMQFVLDHNVLWSPTRNPEGPFLHTYQFSSDELGR